MPGELLMSKSEEFLEELKKLYDQVEEDYVGKPISNYERTKEEIRVKFQNFFDEYYYNSFLEKQFKVIVHSNVTALSVDAVDPDTGVRVEDLKLQEIFNED
jgi:hypothetical protein